MSFNVKTNFVNLFVNEPLELEAGEKLANIQVAFQTYGKLNSEKTNVILVFHALTGNAHAGGILSNIEKDNNSKYDFLEKYSIMNNNKLGWWDGIIGPGKALDTEKYFIICANILGSCYGTTGPTSYKPNSNENWGLDFPVITVRDMIKVHKELLNYLRIEKIKACIGGSLGGFQVLEFGIMYPDVCEILFPIACDVINSDWAIAFNEIQRNIILADKNWNNGNYNGNTIENIGIARMVGLMSYRTPENYIQKFGRKYISEKYYSKNTRFDVSSYFNHQANKFITRFDPISYLTILQATDLHDISYERAPFEDVLGSIKAKTISIVIDTDLLYLPEHQKKFTNLIPDSKTFEISSPYGHDAFLIEFEQLNAILKNYL
ncbi:MAG TPA: homoserine O-acetyltransferase [Ignavibacteriales bacterium]|nr:homoserine O-acetyltransferase [Ignavibacteriales bacterium]HOL80273.1 homoserine O-acetyltransferase [Ignavibacteriales bacterium]HPP32462.1 homoserine O-acetyltransferase [Ignavibacteriales bacterium]